jgi:hypothetical protein
MQVINFIHMGADIRQRHSVSRGQDFHSWRMPAAFLREWVSGFHYLLRDNPSSQFMPLVCSFISHHLPYNLIRVPGLLPTNYFSIHINQIVTLKMEVISSSEILQQTPVIQCENTRNDHNDTTVIKLSMLG